MTSSVEVGMGELVVSDDEEATLTSILGSCVALCLYDRSAGIAGMAHVMLPEGDGSRTSNPVRPGKYADQALETLVEEMVTRGAKIERMRAKVVGGGSIFGHEGGRALLNIGERNVQAVKRSLGTKGIPIVAEDTGNDHGLRIRFSVGSSEVKVESRRDGVRIL